MKKLRVLFVASFCRMPDGGTGGQATVATIIRNSELAKLVEFVPVDSTMQTLPAPPVWKRGAAGCRRMVSFLRWLFASDVVVIFASSGASLVEKGLMARVARLFGRGVVLRISSGRVPEQCERSRRMKTWLRRTLHSANVVISQGPFWTEYLEHYGEARGKIVEIANGVAMAAPPERRHHFTVEPRLSYVGWMVPSKGIYESLAVAARVRAHYPGLILSMAGGGEIEPFREAVRAAGMEDNVRILGWQSADEVQHLLAETDVFLLPSHFEGLPNALLEAMVASVPTVATPAGCVRDLIRNGYDGLLVPVGDVSATTSAVLSLLKDREMAARVGEEGRRTVERQCDIKLLWPRYAEAISRAATEAGRGELALPSSYETLEREAPTSIAAGRER